MSFAQLAHVMISEYDSDPRRLGVQSQLENLTIEAYMSGSKIVDEVVGLTRVVDHMNILKPQCPPSFRSESHEMRHAVLSLS